MCLEENRDLEHWQMNSANISMVSFGPATWSCILSGVRWAPSHIKGSGGESWSADQVE